MPWKILSSPSSYSLATAKERPRRPKDLELFLGSDEAGDYLETSNLTLSHALQYYFIIYMNSSLTSGLLITLDYDKNGDWVIKDMPLDHPSFLFNGNTVNLLQLPLNLKMDDKVTAVADKDWEFMLKFLDVRNALPVPVGQQLQRFQLYSGDYQEIMKPEHALTNHGVPELTPFPLHECQKNPDLFKGMVTGTIDCSKVHLKRGPDDKVIDFGRGFNCLRFRYREDDN